MFFQALKSTQGNSIAEALDWLCLYLPADTFRVGLGKRPSNKPPKASAGGAEGSGQEADSKGAVSDEAAAATPQEPIVRIRTAQERAEETAAKALQWRGLVSDEAEYFVSMLGVSAEAQRQAFAAWLCSFVGNTSTSPDVVFSEGCEVFQSRYGVDVRQCFAVPFEEQQGSGQVRRDCHSLAIAVPLILSLDRTYLKMKFPY